MNKKEQSILMGEAIILARENGITIKNIALETGYSITHVSNVISGITKNKDIIQFILNCVNHESKLNQKLLNKWKEEITQN